MGMRQGVHHLTKQELEDIFELFDSKISIREISELSNRSKSTIERVKNMWKQARRIESTISAIEVSVTESEEPSKLVSSDYAKAYLADDVAVVHSNFEIKRNVQIQSKKTGILYEMSCNAQEKKTLKITLNDGTTFEIELGLFEKFVDEGVDVVIELSRTA